MRTQPNPMSMFASYGQKHCPPPLLIACLLVSFVVASSAWADPFAQASTSTINYQATPYPAKLRCKDLPAFSNFSFSIVSARQIDASPEAPAHCRISGLIPTEVRFEVNLPLEWNGRLYMFGNGGLAGTPAIDPGKQASRDQALQNGFATVYTDTGHDKRVEPGGTFAYQNFHKLVDYGFRAVHLSITSAKEIARIFYAKAPRSSYWNGCSTGGRQAMMSAQRFPDDFDGIIAGAPAADYSGLKFSQAWRVSAISKAGFSEDKVLQLADHIYAKCDAIDGDEDGLIADPRRCDFNHRKDLPSCKPNQNDDACFTETQLAALDAYYAPVMLGGKEVYPAMPVGSEVLGDTGSGDQRTGWYPWLINNDGPVLLDLLGSDFFRYMVFVKDDPSFDWTEFDFANEPDNLAEFRAIVDAVDPDLSQFKRRGGKLLSYFGWADPDINPLTLIDYRAQVAQLDPKVDDYFRVFMIPGMFHCRGGAGPDKFDAMTPLIEWVEGQQAPTSLPLWKAPGPNSDRGSNTDSGTEKDSRQAKHVACAYPTTPAKQGDNWVCPPAAIKN